MNQKISLALLKEIFLTRVERVTVGGENQLLVNGLLYKDDYKELPYAAIRFPYLFMDGKVAYHRKEGIVCTSQKWQKDIIKKLESFLLQNILPIIEMQKGRTIEVKLAKYLAKRDVWLKKIEKQTIPLVKPSSRKSGWLTYGNKRFKNLAAIRVGEQITYVKFSGAGAGSSFYGMRDPDIDTDGRFPIIWPTTPEEARKLHDRVLKYLDDKFFNKRNLS